jgi:hypothetical protein
MSHFSDQDLDREIPDDELIAPVPLEDTFDRVVIVDGTPIAPSAKHELLKGILMKKFTTVSPEVQIHMPVDEKGTTKG